MGVVYEAFDRQRDQSVALKTIRHFDASSLYWFKKEFRTLADVVHPNLVRLWELFSDDDDRWFFTMELVDGTDFLSYVRPAPAGPEGGADPRLVDTIPFLTRPATTARDDGGGSTLPDPDPDPDAPQPRPKPRQIPPTVAEGETECDDGQAPRPDPTTDPDAQETTLPLRVSSHPATPSADAPPGVDLPRLRSALGQLAGALVALHDLGKIHRDLKPSNVMVERGGRVVVLDFGVAAELGRFDEPQSTEFHVVGTVDYMSPEQAVEGALTPASDWYTFGVMLYVALTGRVPFRGSRLEILVRKQKGPPPDPALLAPNLPEDLRALCVDLLQPNPADRPVGEDVLKRLGAAPSPTAASRAPRSPRAARSWGGGPTSPPSNPRSPSSVPARPSPPSSGDAPAPARVPWSSTTSPTSPPGTPRSSWKAAASSRNPLPSRPSTPPSTPSAATSGASLAWRPRPSFPETSPPWPASSPF